MGVLGGRAFWWEGPLVGWWQLIATTFDALALERSKVNMILEIPPRRAWRGPEGRRRVRPCLRRCRPSAPVCLSIYLSIYVYLSIYLYLSMYLSISIYLYLSFYLSTTFDALALERFKVLIRNLT